MPPEITGTRLPGTTPGIDHITEGTRRAMSATFQWSGILDALGADAAGMSPEGIIALAERGLNSANARIREMQGAVMTRNQRLGALTAAVRRLQEWSQTNQGRNVGRDDPQHMELQREMIDDPVTGQPMSLLALLQREGVDVTALQSNRGERTSVPAYHVGTADMDRLREILRGASENVTRDGDLLMMRLQEAVTQRQQIVQMATNMLHKLSEGQNSVVQNIGR